MESKGEYDYEFWILDPFYPGRSVRAVGDFISVFLSVFCSGTENISESKVRLIALRLIK